VVPSLRSPSQGSFRSILFRFATLHQNYRSRKASWELAEFYYNDLEAIC
jgi:hypothetical protein